MRILVDLSENERRSLEGTAKRLGVRVEDLARAAFTDLLGHPQEDFERVAQRVLKKNEEIGAKLQDMCSRLDRGESPDELKVWAERNVLAPLGLHVPAREEGTT